MNELRYNENGLYVEGFDELYGKWLKEREDSFRLKDFSIKENIIIWTADLYFNFINRIVNGEEELNEYVAMSIKYLSDKEFLKFLEFYVNVKRNVSENPNIKYITDIIELLLIKSDLKEYILD